LRDLLLIGFFLSIGFYGLPSIELIAVAFVLALLAALRPLIYFLLLTRFGLRARTGWLTGLSLFSYSEFGLIVAAIAIEQKYLPEAWITTLALAMSLSFFVATPINRQAHSIFRRYGSRLAAYENTERLPEEHIGSLGDARSVVLGMGRVGRNAFDTLRAAGIAPIIGVDENYARACELDEQGYPCLHGDGSDRDFWERTNLVNRDLILVSLTNHVENRQVAQLAQALGFTGTLAVAVRYPDEQEEIESMGCIAYYLYEDTGQNFARYALDRITSSS